MVELCCWWVLLHGMWCCVSHQIMQFCILGISTFHIWDFAQIEICLPALNKLGASVRSGYGSECGIWYCAVWQIESNIVEEPARSCLEDSIEFYLDDGHMQFLQNVSMNQTAWCEMWVSRSTVTEGHVTLFQWVSSSQCFKRRRAIQENSGINDEGGWAVVHSVWQTCEDSSNRGLSILFGMSGA